MGKGKGAANRAASPRRPPSPSNIAPLLANLDGTGLIGLPGACEARDNPHKTPQRCCRMQRRLDTLADRPEVTGLLQNERH